MQTNNSHQTVDDYIIKQYQYLHLDEQNVLEII